MDPEVSGIAAVPSNSSVTVEIYFPDFLNTDDKYNHVIRETKDLDDFMNLILRIAGDPQVSPERLLTLVTWIERDMKLVHNSDDFSKFLKVVRAMVEFMQSTWYLFLFYRKLQNSQTEVKHWQKRELWFLTVHCTKMWSIIQKEVIVLAIVKCDYFKRYSIHDWFKADIAEEILEKSDFVYIYSCDDSPEKITHLFKLYEMGYRNKQLAFSECGSCKCLGVVGNVL